MSLTGLPLLIVVAGSASLCALATMFLWSRSGRARFVVRTVGVLLTEALVVCCVGLLVNRSEQFYPSWAALTAGTGTKSSTADVPRGDLDATLKGQPRVSWHPPSLAGWHLAEPPTVTVPSDYFARSAARFPVLVVLGRSTAAGAPVAGVVTVQLSPTRETASGALQSMVADLRRDVRVGAAGWAVVADAGEMALAGEFTRALPAQFRGLAVVQRSASATLAPAGRMPPGTALAAVRPVATGGTRAATLPRGVIALTATPAKAWRTAATWAKGLLSPPLDPPMLLPPAAGRTE